MFFLSYKIYITHISNVYLMLIVSANAWGSCPISSPIILLYWWASVQIKTYAWLAKHILVKYGIFLIHVKAANCLTFIHICIQNLRVPCNVTSYQSFLYIISFKFLNSLQILLPIIIIIIIIIIYKHYFN